MNLVRRSLRLKVSLGISLALILLLTPFNWLQYQLQRRAAIADLSQLAVTTGTADDGVGLPDATLDDAAGVRQAFGILGMQERAEALGGRLEVTRRAPRGTRVTLWLPVRGARNESNPRFAGRGSQRRT